MSETAEVHERLEAAARKRWGDDWTIQTLYLADGTTSSHLFHSCGLIEAADGAVLECERLFPVKNGGVGYEHVHLRKQEVVDVLKRELLNEYIDS